MQEIRPSALQLQVANSLSSSEEGAPIELRDVGEELRKEISRAMGHCSYFCTPLPSFSNKNYLLNSRDGKTQLVLRLGDDLTNEICSRDDEERNIQEVVRSGLFGFDLIYFSVSTGDLLSKYIESRPLNNTDFADQKIFLEVISALKKLHESDVCFRNKYEWTKRQVSVFSQSAASSIHRYSDLKWFHETIMGFYRSIDVSKFEWLPSHNDPSPQNFLKTANGVTLVDWETSGLNDPVWDLAHLSVMRGAGDLSSDMEILNLYGYRKLDIGLNKIQLFKLFIFFDGLLWASMNMDKEFGPGLFNLRYQQVKSCLANRINLEHKSGGINAFNK